MPPSNGVVTIGSTDTHVVAIYNCTVRGLWIFPRNLQTRTCQNNGWNSSDPVCGKPVRDFVNNKACMSNNIEM